MEEALLRKENETQLQYVKRVTDNKDILDIDYSEWANLICGKQYSSENARKAYYIIKPMLQNINTEIESNIEDDEILNQLELKKIELEKERVKFSDQRREYKNLIKQQARAEHIKHEFNGMIKRINEIKPLKVEEYPIAHSDKEGLLLLSDWHFGIATSNFWNEFNSEIFYGRIEKLLVKTIQYGKLHNIKTLHIFNLADLQNGLIHVTTRIENEENVVKQTQVVAEVLSDMISKLANTFESVKVYNVLGNHERVIANKNESIYEESFAEFIPWYLEARLSNIKNIEIIKSTIDKSLIVANICDKLVYGIHGDLDKISNVVQNLTLMTKMFPSYVCMGHVHHMEENEVHGVEIIVNSTLSGTDSYAKNLRLTSKPSQKFMIFSEDGRECTYNILL